MSSSPLPMVSPVLRETANLKIEELKRFSEHFTKNIISDLNKDYDQHEARDAILARLATLFDRVEAYEPQGIVDDEFAMWIRRIEQAQYDRSITSEKLVSMEKAFHQKLEKFANRLAMSEFHVALVEHALHTPDVLTDIGAILDKVVLDDEFELIEEEVDSVYTAFEQHAFKKRDLDDKAINDYLGRLFEDAVGDVQLQKLRRQMENYGEDLLFGEDKLNVELVEWCVEDLHGNGLLSAEKRSTLQGYLQSEAAMRELTEILNAKSIRHWNWRNGDEGLLVTAKKNADGKYCIIVEEDIIDMLFLHALAVRWSMEVKEALKGLTSTRAETNDVTSEELEKRETSASSVYFLHYMPSSYAFKPLEGLFDASAPASTTNKQRRKAVLPPVPRFNSCMPRSKKARRSLRVPLPPPLPYDSSMSVDEERGRVYMQKFLLSRIPKSEGCSAEKASDAETKAALFKMLALDIKTREAFDGSVHGLTANFRSFASSMAHETILAVLGFIGISEEWLGIFKRFLSAPLNMGPVVRGTSDQVRTRTSGMPIAHGFETFFGEAVLFCLDLAVSSRTSSEKTTPYLLRLRDECYFVGKHQQCEEAQEQIETFAKVMGLDVGVKDLFPPASGPGVTIEYITFHRNDADASERPNKVTISVNMAEVSRDARRVKNILASCPTVFAWVTVWNRSIGAYGSHGFGPLANVFGKSHLEAVTRAYNLAYETIFEDSNLTEHLKKLLPCALPLGDSTFTLEAWIHLPVAYGGLGVKNPYATLNYARHMLTDPDAALTDYLDSEQKYYEHTGKTFAKLTTKQREDKLKGIFDGDEERIASVFGPDWTTSTVTFPSLQDLTARRERLSTLFDLRSVFENPFARHSQYPFSYDSPTLPPPSPSPPSLLDTYRMLASPAPPSHFSASDRVLDDVYRLAGKLDMTRWERMCAEDKWAVGLYGDECFGAFGGLEVWWGRGAQGVLRVVRGGAGGEGEGMGE
ncbi:uncharacterized protein N0V89_000056 [Didymosphaeria variabile]|uniref:Reverse transcriptase domain-containing protein n=1 Tax=Didymosphaeria variabile TaxID=1932322 RepID=A0A9W8XUK6_9PLEO|nr:uncharacterized protein N0V89_000056 [Didymosphaeria variabile]KAJ4359501.1 hypothetical protein N0V89_000056 [Didymosphaeria variabile]